MKNEEISLNTKKMLTESLKKAMLKKPLSKITVSELIKDCGINRNTFYYHFANIYDLLKWMLEQEAIEVVKNIDLLINTEEAFRFILDYVDANKHIIACAYDSMGHEEIKRFFYNDFIGVMGSAIESLEQDLQISLTDSFRSFLAMFFTEALAGTMINYIKNNESQDREEVIQNLLVICKISLKEILLATGEKISK